MTTENRASLEGMLRGDYGDRLQLCAKLQSELFSAMMGLTDEEQQILAEAASADLFRRMYESPKPGFAESSEQQDALLEAVSMVQGVFANRPFAPDRLALLDQIEGLRDQLASGSPPTLSEQKAVLMDAARIQQGALMKSLTLIDRPRVSGAKGGAAAAAHWQAVAGEAVRLAREEGLDDGTHSADYIAGKIEDRVRDFARRNGRDFPGESATRKVAAYLREAGIKKHR